MANASSRPISRALRIRLRIYALIALALVVVTVVEVARGRIGSPLAAAGVGAGLLGGLVVARMFDIDWDHEGEQVVAQIDWLGGVILLLYIAYVVFRNRVLGIWAEGPTLAALGLAVTAGVMIGRVAGSVRGIRRVLQALAPAGGARGE